MRRRIGVLVVCGSVSSVPIGCASDPIEAQASLDERSVFARLLAVEPMGESDDPLHEHRPEMVACNNVVGWYAENEGIEVDTGHCNYLALRTPAAIAAPRGAWVDGQISHFDLTAPEPTTAHIAIVIGNRVAWQQTWSIPADAKVHPVEFELPVDVAEGDDVGLHLHNHGQNTYLLQKLYVSPARDVDR